MKNPFQNGNLLFLWLPEIRKSANLSKIELFFQNGRVCLMDRK